MSATNKVPANPAKVEFPRDIWGATTELRRAGLKCAGKITHDEQKLTTYLQTLGILAQHAQARFAENKAAREKYLARFAQNKAAREKYLASLEVEDTTEEPTDG